MSEISIYRALFLRQKLFPIINYYYSQSVTPCPVLISVTLPCFACFIRGVLFESTILRVQLLRRNPSVYPAALLHPPTWLFGLKEAIVSTSFIHCKKTRLGWHHPSQYWLQPSEGNSDGGQPSDPLNRCKVGQGDPS
jgi:hypothetical protein